MLLEFSQQFSNQIQLREVSGKTCCIVFMDTVLDEYAIIAEKTCNLFLT